MNYLRFSFFNLIGAAFVGRVTDTRRFLLRQFAVGQTESHRGDRASSPFR